MGPRARDDTGSRTRLRDIGFGPFRLLGLALSVAVVAAALLGVGRGARGPASVPFPMTYPMPPSLHPTIPAGREPELAEPDRTRSSIPDAGTLPTVDTVASNDGVPAPSTALETDTDQGGATSVAENDMPFSVVDCLNGSVRLPAGDALQVGIQVAGGAAGQGASGAAGDDDALTVVGHRQGVVVLGGPVLMGPEFFAVWIVRADEGVDAAGGTLPGKSPFGRPHHPGVPGVVEGHVPGVVGEAGPELIGPQRGAGAVEVAEEGGCPSR